MKRVLLMTAAGLVLAHSAFAGMENCRFALHWKPKFSATKTIGTLCPNASSPLATANYSPNWGSATATPAPIDCKNYVVSGPLGAAQVYIVVGKAGTEGVAGASFGINYHGGTNTNDAVGIAPQFVQFTACADGLSFPNSDAGCTGLPCDFPAPKGGIRITWNNTTSCQTQVIGTSGVHAVVGSLYVYAYSNDQLQLTPNNNLQGGVPELAVANCAGVTTDLYQVWGAAITNQLCSRCDFGAGAGYNACLLTPVANTTWGKIKNKYNNSTSE
jgi:hypothetical protein